MKFHIICLLILIVLAGCATSSLRAPLPSYPGNDAATLYVARPPGVNGAAAPIHIVLDGTLLGVIGTGEYWRLTLKPGKHTLGTWTGEHEIILEPNKVTCYSTGYALTNSSTWVHLAEECPPPTNWKLAAESGSSQ